MESGPIPEQELVDIQEALRKYLPELAELNVSSTRMCWLVPYFSLVLV